MDSTDLASNLGAFYGAAEFELTAMPGSTSADLYLVSTGTDRAGVTRHVLRRFRQERWETPANDLCLREQTILQAMQDSELPVPAPVGVLPDNGVIMTWLPGEVVLPATPDTEWLDQLAANLVRIHGLNIAVPYEYESWNDSIGTEAPDWWDDAALWTAAQADCRSAPAYVPVFVHRDYHPVNILFEHGSVSGVVDWINACMGPAGIDVAHCRLNLAIMYGQPLADAFLGAYRRHAPDYQHHPYWDLDDALGALPDVKVYPPWEIFGLTGLSTELVRHRLLEFVRAAVRGLAEK